jgi:uncharacterized alpha-E superfamily protein
MLSRIANNLCWVGRYLERAEHMASFTKVYYLASMDASFSEDKEAIWEFLLQASKSRQEYFNIYPQVEEDKVLRFIALDKANPASVHGYVTKAREQAREARDSISAELWEHINCFYHTLNAYSEERLQQKGFYSFAQKVEKYSYTIKGYIESIMIRNDAWQQLTLGYHLERAVQANMLMLGTLQQLQVEQATEHAQAYKEQKMKTMLESLGAYEMYKHHYQTTINQHDFLDFIVFNTAFPKSIAFNLSRIQQLSREEGNHGQAGASSFREQATALAAGLVLENAHSLQGRELEFLEKNLEGLHRLAGSWEVQQVVY